MKIFPKNYEKNIKHIKRNKKIVSSKYKQILKEISKKIQELKESFLPRNTEKYFQRNTRNSGCACREAN